MGAEEAPSTNLQKQMTAPLVSIIMPCYRVSQYIKEALDSILSQTFSNYEIIIVNDGSPDTDEFEKALQPYMEKVIYIRQDNRGCAGARNTGIRVARGKYLALLDPDDVWEKNYLEIQVGILEQNPAIDLVYPNALIFGDTPDAGRLFMDLSPSDGDVTLESLITQRCNVMISVTVRRDAVVAAGMFDESLRSSEDFDLWLRLLYQGSRFDYHRLPLVRYRRRRDSLSANPVWMCQSILNVLHKAECTMNLTLMEHAVIKHQKLYFRALQELYEGKNAFFQGESTAAIERLLQANQFFKSSKLWWTCLFLRTSPQLLKRAYSLRERLNK